MALKPDRSEETMTIGSLEKAQMKRIKTYICSVLSLFFLLIFLLTSMFIFHFPMVGLADIVYAPSKIAFTAFFCSLLFSLLIRKNLFALVIMLINLLLMLFMLMYGP